MTRLTLTNQNLNKTLIFSPVNVHLHYILQILHTYQSADYSNAMKHTLLYYLEGSYITSYCCILLGKPKADIDYKALPLRDLNNSDSSTNVNNLIGFWASLLPLYPL